MAQLAGISIAYYTWIEQGRRLNVSRDVLDAIARVLRLTSAERAHLHTLVGLAVYEGVNVEESEIHPTLVDLLTNSPSVCALTHDPWFNVLAATALATAIYGLRPDGSTASNLLYRLFAEPAQRALWLDWESEARMLVGMFRDSLARWPNSDAGKQLLERLGATSDFATLWQSYDIRLHPSPDEYFRAEPWELDHPEVGGLRIHRIAMAIPTCRATTLVLSSPSDPVTSSKFQYLLEPAKARPRLFLVSA